MYTCLRRNPYLVVIHIGPPEHTGLVMIDCRSRASLQETAKLWLRRITGCAEGEAGCESVRGRGHGGLGVLASKFLGTTISSQFSTLYGGVAQQALSKPQVRIF